MARTAKENNAIQCEQVKASYRSLHEEVRQEIPFGNFVEIAAKETILHLKRRSAVLKQRDWGGNIGDQLRRIRDIESQIIKGERGYEYSASALISMTEDMFGVRRFASESKPQSCNCHFSIER